MCCLVVGGVVVDGGGCVGVSGVGVGVGGGGGGGIGRVGAGVDRCWFVG